VQANLLSNSGFERPTTGELAVQRSLGFPNALARLESGET